jgi:hypothetical protein
MRFLMQIKETAGAFCEHLSDRTMPPNGRAPARALCEGVRDMTVLMITVWLALQIPGGMLLGPCCSARRRWCRSGPPAAPGAET